MRHILGIILIATPFVAVFAISLHTIRLWETLAVFGISVVVIAMIYVGVGLL